MNRAGTVAFAPLFVVAWTVVAAPQAQTSAFHRFATAEAGATQKLTFDGRRERMVKVESSAFTATFATWEWLGDGWSLRRTPTQPPPRSDFALGYDEARRRIVLFGGRTEYNLNPTALLDDTWEYDGVDWVQLQPVQRPTRQAYGWLGHDWVHNKLFLCGGTNGAANYAAWHFDGATWTQAPVSYVSNVTGTFASDPVRQRIVGYAPVGSGNLMCEWDGTAWAWVNPPTWPTPRYSSAMTWVPSLQRIVLHGGTGAGTSAPAPGDLWAYDGVAWSLLGPAPVRNSHVVCHDPVRDVLFAVAGRVPQGLGVDTAQWDGSAWTSHGNGIGWEDLRGAWFDGHRQRVVALSMYPLNWLEWDGSAWLRHPSPVALVYPRGAFDPMRNRSVVVGSDTSGVVTQEWDGTTWTLPVVAGQPCVARPTFHPGRGKLVASCGLAGLYEWNGVAWTQFAPGPGAPWSSVADGECVFDAAHNELVQVAWSTGGFVTARWNGTTWNVATATGAAPVSRVEHSFVYDPPSQRVLLFGGKSGTGTTAVVFDDLWEWDGAAWSQRVLSAAPGPRSRGVFVFDEARQQMVVFAGDRQVTSFGSVPCTDTWAYDSRPAHVVQTVGAGCSGTNGALQLVPGVPHAGAAQFAVEAHGAFANTPCLFGFSFNAGAVPIGAGCTQWLASQDALMFVVADDAGIATVTGAIPLAWHGTAWFAQAAVLDATNPLGVSLSDGVRLVAGY
ncbi:MAG: hypothetical protein JNK15_14105 [Planctomycetes bacterium]|nr:hypothetical protein [Planctomycetota bacterium]